MKLDFFVVFTIGAGIVLFGSLFLSVYSKETLYFIVGYPLSIIFLLLALVNRRKFPS